VRRRRVSGVVPAMLGVIVAVAGLSGCPKPVPAGEAFHDDFARAELGPRYKKTGGSWRIVDGKLSTLGDHNLALWLDVPLSRNVRVEFTTISRSPAVDTKIEIFGDGVRHESGYSVIIGGWNNTITTIARLGEHQPGRKEIRRRWEKDRAYRWTVQRTDGKTVELFIDGEKILAYEDPEPLFGAHNNALAFNSWESDVTYDDVVVTPLP